MWYLRHHKEHESMDFLSYTFAMGRNVLQTHIPPPRSIVTQWHSIIPTRLKFEWGNLCDKMCHTKEGTFIWSIWHKVIVLNSWRARVIADIDDKCQMCMLDILKTITHRHRIVSGPTRPGQKGLWKPLDWQHGVFGKKTPISLDKYL